MQSSRRLIDVWEEAIDIEQKVAPRPYAGGEMWGQRWRPRRDYFTCKRIGERVWNDYW